MVTVVACDSDLKKFYVEEVFEKNVILSLRELYEFQTLELNTNVFLMYSINFLHGNACA